MRELHIDIGAADGDEARSLVRIGDVAVIDGEPVELRDGRVISRSMDNRLGCFVAYEAARLVAEAGGAPGDVIAVAAVQEETGLNGARTIAHRLRPGLAIAVDVTHATDAPGIDEAEIGRHHLGSGPVIERGTSMHPVDHRAADRGRRGRGDPVHARRAPRAATGTDADAIFISRGGVPTGLVSMPLRYMHSPVEMVQLEDVDNAARLIAAFAQRLPADVTFER